MKERKKQTNKQTHKVTVKKDLLLFSALGGGRRKLDVVAPPRVSLVQHLPRKLE